MLVRRRHALGCGMAALALGLVAGCGAETSVTQLWNARIPAAPVKTLIVFGAHMDEANRRSLEDAYVAELSKHAVLAKPSYAFFPAGEAPARDDARQAVKAAGFDGILVSKMRSVRETQSYVPGYAGGFWYGYYGPSWTSWSPGYVFTDRIVDFDTTLWDTRSGDELVFAVTTETSNPSSNQSFIHSLTKTVLSSLDEKRLIPPGR
jgi:hypothetical protein